MKLACNWSAELDRLLREGCQSAVRLDYLKAGAIGCYEDLFSKIRKQKPILLHGLGYGEAAGMTNAETLNFDKINSLLEYCGAPHLGIHLSIQNSDLQKEQDEMDIAEKMISNIEIFKKNINVPILAENTPDSGRDRTVFGHYPFYNAETISRIVNKTGIGFLLDITHARVTCLYNGLDVHRYISDLPLSRVREIHVNGLGFDEDGQVIDSHSVMTDEDFELLKWVLENTSPEIVTLEYGWQMESEFCAEIGALKKNLERLIELVC